MRRAEDWEPIWRMAGVALVSFGAGAILVLSLMGARFREAGLYVVSNNGDVYHSSAPNWVPGGRDVDTLAIGPMPYMRLPRYK